MLSNIDFGSYFHTKKYEKGLSTGGDKIADWGGSKGGWGGHVPPSLYVKRGPGLYQTCWNNIATSLIIPTRLLLLQVLTSCCILVDNLGQAVRTQLVDGLLADLLQDVRLLRRQQVVFALLVPSCQQVWTKLSNNAMNKSFNVMI